MGSDGLRVVSQSKVLDMRIEVLMRRVLSKSSRAKQVERARMVLLPDPTDTLPASRSSMGWVAHSHGQHATAAVTGPLQWRPELRELPSETVTPLRRCCMACSFNPQAADTPAQAGAAAPSIYAWSLPMPRDGGLRNPQPLPALRAFWCPYSGSASASPSWLRSSALLLMSMTSPSGP